MISLRVSYKLVMQNVFLKKKVLDQHVEMRVTAELI